MEKASKGTRQSLTINQKQRSRTNVMTASRNVSLETKNAFPFLDKKRLILFVHHPNRYYQELSAKEAVTQCSINRFQAPDQ